MLKSNQKKALRLEDSQIETETSPGIILQYISQEEENIIGNISWSPDGKQLASQSSNIITLHNIETGISRIIFRTEGPEKIRWVSWNPINDTLAIAIDSYIKIISATDGIILFSLKGHKKSINELVFSPTGDLLASSSQDGTVRIWDIVLQQEKILAGVYTSITSILHWSPDG
ncbi:MAG: hypothetical protein WCF67_21460, partial [Chitinophagaceae bacterium]